MPVMMALMALGLAAPSVTITWDKALAFERDRDAYEARLREQVTDAYETQARAFGLPLPRGVAVQVHTPAQYAATFGSALARRSAAHYRRSAIHVNGGRRLNGAFAATMHHEMVHAFVDYRGTARFVPMWLNEGLAEVAEKYSRRMDTLAPSQWQQLNVLAERGQVPKLVDRGHLRHLDYLLSWAAVLFIDAEGGPGAARDVVLGMVRDGQSLKVALDKHARLDVRTFERDFARWLKRRRP